jgi:hypothetical protein
MKRTARKPTNLSESLHQRLNSYALAASAAGVGMLALAQPAEAKIVYTPTDKVIKTNEAYPLDLDHDKKADFFITNSGTHCGTDTCHRSLNVEPMPGNAVAGGIENRVFYAAWALGHGQRIDSRSLLKRGAGMAVVWEPSGSTCSWGYWCNVTNRYLGLQFKIHGQTHYGWARLSVKVSGTVIPTLTGYAYETIPNKPIIAGKTHGPDVITLKDATLGHLARGASAIPAWRQKQSIGDKE